MLRYVILIIKENLAYLLEEQFKSRFMFSLTLMLTGFDGGIQRWEDAANFNNTNLYTIYTDREINRIQFLILRKILRYLFIYRKCPIYYH